MPQTRWILALADDLTGALEVGAKFAGHGLYAVVTTETSIPSPPESAVLVIDTETRHLPPSDATASVHNVLQSALRFPPWLVYKKTDSTLRGNIAAELNALLDLMPERPLVYAPAYPDMGRTVQNGSLFIDGIPAHQTAFARDPLNPVQDSSIRALLAGVPARVLDGLSNSDLAAAASEILARDPPAIAAGPAALAEALAERLCPLPRGRPNWPLARRFLVVNGSLHPAAAAQIAFARSQGWFENEWSCFDADTGGEGVDRALRTGECVRRLLESASVDGLIIFGGDTAFGIHRALGSPRLEPYGEVVQGVPVSRCGDLLWVTKAGGFGAPDILRTIRQNLI
ncbi:MAG TPA: four-carbon acid sugar kinase family protein [Bryobacteraceae bacterium]|nr:four-carbon acid sugar kinase family protein [Bryobacteraceae bacterium]